MAVQLLASNIATANALDLTELDHAAPQQHNCATGLKASLSRRFGNAARHLYRGTVKWPPLCVRPQTMRTVAAVEHRMRNELR